MEAVKISATVFFSAIEFFAGILLALSIFRIPFRYSFPKTIVIALAMSLISTYVREFIGVDYTLIPVITSEIILITFFFNIPVFYSILVSVVCFLFASIFETLFIILGTKLGMTTQELLSQSELHLSTLELVNSIFMFLIIWILQKQKIGFQFLAKHLSGKQPLKGYNFMLTSVFIIAIIGLQFQLFAFKEHNIQFYFPIIISVISIIGIIIAYLYNKKIIRRKFERSKVQEVKE
jgi:hypothetical protein